MTTLVYSSNGEEFREDFESVLDAITGYHSMTLEDALDADVYVGEQVFPKINSMYLFDRISEDISTQLYEECGEYADCYTPSHTDELKSFLTYWLAKQQFNCYTVTNVKVKSILDFVTVKDLEEIYA